MSGGILHFNDPKTGMRAAYRLGVRSKPTIVRKETVTQNTQMVVCGYMYCNTHHSIRFFKGNSLEKQSHVTEISVHSDVQFV
jgi:hypothetical protein